MPNVNRPMGFQPIQHGAGGVPGRSGSYSIASELAQDLFTGDLVTLTGTGRNITVATVATGMILGSFQGCRYVDAQGNVVFAKHWPSGTVAKALHPGGFACEAIVADDPFQYFLAQMDDTAGLVVADVGNAADFIAGAGNALTGISGHQVDQSSLGDAQQLRIVDLWRAPDNDYGQFAKAVVQIRNHVYLNINTSI